MYTIRKSISPSANLRNQYNERISPIKDTFNDLQAILEGKLNS